MPCENALRQVKSALKRLAASDTPRKRKNARLAFRRALRGLGRAADESYRPLRGDGTVVEKSRRRGYACPHCRQPQKSIADLIAHLRARHRFPTYPVACPCGKQFGSTGASDYGLRRHLAAQPDIGVHLAGAALVAAAEAAGPGGEVTG